MRPVKYRTRSVSVVLPASTCAMMPRLRIRSREIVRDIQGSLRWESGFGNWIRDPGKAPPRRGPSEVRTARASGARRRERQIPASGRTIRRVLVEDAGGARQTDAGLLSLRREAQPRVVTRPRP